MIIGSISICSIALLIWLYFQLLESSKKPKGTIGRLLMKLWDRIFLPMHRWGISKAYFKEKSTILDIGAGSGQSSRLLAQEMSIHRVIACDFSLDAVQRMKETLQTSKIEILQTSVTKLPFENNTFDGITAFQTHFHWSPFEQGIHEIYRVLKNDGICLIVSESDKPKYHLKAYATPDTMISYLKSIGFKNITTESYRNWTSYRMIK